ncbi:hypothetical protein KAK06_21190, partial [Ideonella sp. 4Y11]
MSDFMTLPAMVGEITILSLDAHKIWKNIESNISAISRGDVASIAGIVQAAAAANEKINGIVKAIGGAPIGLTILAAQAAYEISAIQSAMDVIAGSPDDAARQAAIDTIVISSISMVGIAGAIGATIGPDPYSKATGIAIAASATAIKEIYSSRAPISEAIANGIREIEDSIRSWWAIRAGNGNPADCAWSVDGGNPFGISISCSAAWQSATTWRPRRDPLALDLDGDGIETLGVRGGIPVLFDHDGDGVRTGTGWLRPDDSWLTLDRNGNGLIDSGRELFGVDTLISDGYGGQRTASNGFEALASLDSNGDQLFDSRDTAFQQVRLWRDANGDGVSQASELSTLSEQGVLSISLQYTSENTNLGNGNMVTGTATVTRTDGSQTDAGSVDITGAASNLDLSENPFYRDFPDDVPISDSAAALPDMSGSGWVRDLREAMSLPDERAASLVAAVEAFAAGANRDAQRAQLDDVLIRWADGTGRLTDGSNVREMIGTVVAEDEHTLTLHWTIADPDQQTGGAYATADFGFAADKYYEWSYDGPPGYPPHKVLTPEALVILRRLEVLEVFNGSRFLDFTEVASKDPIGDGDGGGGGGGGTDPGLHFEIRIADEQVQLINDAYRELSESVYGALVVQTRLNPYFEAATLRLDEDTVSFDVSGTLAMLEARSNQDGLAAVQDLVDMNRVAAASLDAIGLDGPGLLRHYIELLPKNAGTADALAAMDVLMADVSTGSARADIFLGDGGASSLNGGQGDDLIDASGGDDLAHGGEGDDRLFGGDGRDALYGDVGNDVLDGGSGDDWMVGGTGSDLYLMSVGGGKDTIDSRDADPNSLDLLQIRQGVKMEDLSLFRSGNDLVISFRATTDQSLVVGQFNADGLAGVDAVYLFDGAVLTREDIGRLAGAATDGNDLIGLGGSADYFNAAAGDDSVDGAHGNDTLLGGVGADTLVGGVGNDSLDGGVGGDTYLMKAGDGVDTVSEYDSTPGNVDTVRFADLASTRLSALERRDNNLVLRFDSGEQVTISNQFNADVA